MKKDNEKRYDFLKEMISRQTEQIESLKLQIEELEAQCEEKDKIINSVNSLKSELTNDVNEVKKYKEEYRILIKELREMRNIMNQTVFKGKWKLIKFLIK